MDNDRPLIRFAEDDDKNFYEQHKRIYDLFIEEEMDYVMFIGSSTENQIVSDLNAFAMVNKVKIVEINSAQGLMGDTTKTITGDPFDIIPDLCEVIKEKFEPIIKERREKKE